MKHLSLPALLCLLLACLLSTVLTAQADTTECPYFNVVADDSTGISFSLLSTDVDATISGVIANVVVEQTYYNGGDSTIDATYVFPMSTRAAIYAMEMELNGRVIKAEIRRRDEARDLFEQADSTGLTASLLEQERPNVFQMSLANIAWGDTLKVRMTYTELLVPTQGVYQFVFPSVVGPRFTLGGEQWVYDAIANTRPLAETDLSIDLKINAGMELTAECISHDAPMTYGDETASTTLATSPGDDFIVNYTLDKEEIKTGLLLYEGEEENFFLAMLQPARPNVSFPSPPREYIFIMDVSGSMNGQPLEISRELIFGLINDLGPEDRFNVLFFAGGSRLLFPESRAATADNREAAVAMLTDLQGGGGTLLLPAMERALDLPVPDDYSRIFTIMTDGYVAVESQTYSLIRERLDEANFFAFGIGNAVNRFIIEGIAYVGEGESFVVTTNEDPAVVAATFRQYIERPTLNNITVDFAGIEVYDVEPLRVPDVFAERPVIVYGKYHGSSLDGFISLNGELADGSVSSTLAFADYAETAPENVALPYLWARKRIRLMSDYGIADNPNDTLSIEEEITRLGLQYSLVTKYTSFVAIDSNAVSPVATEEEEGDGGTTSDSWSLSGEQSNRAVLHVFGTVVSSGEPLRVQLENFDGLPTEGWEFQVTGANGQLVSRQPLGTANAGQPFVLDLPQLPAGTYFVSLAGRGELLATAKFIVR